MTLDPSTSAPSELNRAGRRAEERSRHRARKAGAAIAALPTALGTTALVLGASALPAGADTLTVTNLNATGAGSLHDLAEAAADGDVIVFQAGLSGTITLTQEIDIDTAITIQGPGAGVITVSGNNTFRIFDIDTGSNGAETVTISGLTLTGGAANFGGAIRVDDSDLTLLDMVITGNAATSSGGGGIAGEDANQDLRIERSTISGNTADDYGGGIYWYSEGGSVTIIDSTITGNVADDDGGGGIWAMLSASTQGFRLSNSTVSGNTADEVGGGLAVYFAPVTIESSTISGNTSGSGGGGAFFYYVPGDLTITNSVISGNTADGYGGGLYVYWVDGNLRITGTQITGNTAGGSGGGGMWVRHVGADATVSNSVISGNTVAYYGGGLYLGSVDGTTTIEFSTIADNDAGEDGGGILFYNSDGDLVIRNSTISGNTAVEGGGGIYFAALNRGVLQVFNSTISGNTVGGDGGGIWFGGYDGATIVQSTITANTAADGGGIYIGADVQPGEAEARAAERDARKDARAAARAAQAAESEDGGDRSRPPRTRPQQTAPAVRPAALAPIQVIGSIVWGNTANDIADVGSAEITSSIVGVVSETVVVDKGGNKFGVNPLLGALADNGGPTQTHALLPGSPAIDAGPNPLPVFPGNADDQRGPGYPRVVAGIVDIGAFEVQPVAVTPTFTG